MRVLRCRLLAWMPLVFSVAAAQSTAMQNHYSNSAPDQPCPSTAFVTLASGHITAVDWVDYEPLRLHSVTILTQSVTVDATLDKRPDQSTVHSSVVVSTAGESQGQAKLHDFAAGELAWADFITSSVADAVARAHYLNKDDVSISAISPYEDLHGSILVHRVDYTDWTVTYHSKKYLVLTDEAGCMISATLPEHGVTIERRIDFPRSAYPLWTPYGAPPDGAYIADQVKIPAPQGHVLAGTLTVPPSPKQVPAAVLITGLGKNNRNNGTPPYMLFRDIADVLTRAGFAVLRVDDRGVAESTGDRAPSTTYDEADDVRTEVKWLRARQEVDPKRVMLVGYSEGGLIAPMVAASDPTIAAIITLAGPGIPGEQLAHEQTEMAVSHNPDIVPSKRQEEVERELAEPMTVRERVVLTINPIEYDSKVRCPALVIQGGADITVPIRSAERIANAMRGNGNRDVTVEIVPGVSHSLNPDPVGDNDSRWRWLPSFEVSSDILQLISTWASSHVHS